MPAHSKISLNTVLGLDGVFRNQDMKPVYAKAAPLNINNKQSRVGGSKGKEGRADHTAGKKAFKRPCTVGWKSQNQPLRGGGGGNRTPL